MTPDTLLPSYSPLSPQPPAPSRLFTHCVHHTALCLSYLQPHPCSLYIASTILSSVSPTSSHILTPDTLRPSYIPLSPLPLATSWLFTHCVHHTVLCLPNFQPHIGSLYISSIIQSSVFSTSSHTFVPYTLRPPYCPQLLLPPTTSWCLIHYVHLQPHTCSLYIPSTIQSPVSPTANHILAPDTLRPTYCPLSPLPPATSWLFTHCVHHSVLCLSYLQPHPCSLYFASTIQSPMFPTSNHILAPETLRPPHCPLSPYLQPHPGSLHIASIIQSSVFPTSSHTLTPYTLPPPYYPLLFLPPATSWILKHCVHHTVPCLSYLQPHPGS